MMERDEHYDDLTALFEAQDEALKSDAFVEQVMTPIHRRARWRGPLLFGAGGLGIGAAVSQIGGVFDLLKTRAGDMSGSIAPIETPAWQTVFVDPLWDWRNYHGGCELCRYYRDRARLARRPPRANRSR